MCFYTSFIISTLPPPDKPFILSYISDQFGEFCCNIDFFKKKRKYLSHNTAKTPLQIFLWLDDFVMSAWLQSRQLFWLDNGHKSTRILSVDKIPFATQKCFTEAGHSGWSTFSGLPSYNRDYVRSLSFCLVTAARHKKWKWNYFNRFYWYLCQGRSYVTAGIYMSVYLILSKITKKLWMDLMKLFRKMLIMGQGTDDYIFWCSWCVT